MMMSMAMKMMARVRYIVHIMFRVRQLYPAIAIRLYTIRTDASLLQRLARCADPFAHASDPAAPLRSHPHTKGLVT